MFRFKYNQIIRQFTRKLCKSSLDLNKKVIYIGDIHDGYEFSCTDNKTIPIENYIDLLFKTDIEIDLFSDLNIQCGLLCVKISVPNDCSETLKGIDKLNKTFYGNIPFSQFILNFDYELSLAFNYPITMHRFDYILLAKLSLL